MRLRRWPLPVLRPPLRRRPVLAPALRRWLLLVPALCVAACTGSLFKSQAAPPTVYLLTPATRPAADASPHPAVQAAPAPAAPAVAAPPAMIPVDLAVLKPRLRPGLDNDRIAAVYPDRHLDYFADARWSGPLAEVLQDLVLREFRAHGDLRTVSGDASLFSSSFWLEIEVTDFQAEYTAGTAAPDVHVRLLARVGSSDDRHILGQFSAGADQAAAENRLTSIVEAYAQAADAALTELVARVDEALSRPEIR